MFDKAHARVMLNDKRSQIARIHVPCMRKPSVRMGVPVGLGPLCWNEDSTVGMGSLCSVISVGLSLLNPLFWDGVAFCREN